MSTSRLTTLGGFAFDINGISAPGPATRKARALMAFLMINRDSDAARERLLEIFWPDVDQERARDSLKTALWSIRRCLRSAGIEADEVLLANKSTVRWTGETFVDAVQFAKLATRDEPGASQQALELYRGDFLEGDYDDWAVAERERLAALYETVLSRIVRTSKDTEAAQRFIARNPYDEDAYVALIEADLGAARRFSAASWVERCRKALAEVGEKPSAMFEARFGNIVRVEPVVAKELTLPFAGREPELSLLAARFVDATAGHGSLTLLHGEAGIGKSTLLDRATQIASENGFRVVLVRCSSETPNTFGPWQEIFSAVVASDFDTFVRTHAGDLVAAVAQAIAARLTKPTVLIVDDTHELTGEALDIFVSLSELAVSKHVVLAGLRPEGVSLLRSRFADTSFEEMPIDHLDRNNLKWALVQALGNEQPDVLEVLYDRTRGHPLFFTGLLNSLVDTGALARDGHRWRLVKPIDATLELPDSVKRFIETRLRARGDVVHTVACALALEPASNADDLMVILHLEEGTILDALDDLLALGLITQPATGAQFAFNHDLIREVAAAGLNAGRRTALHRAFAQRLQTSGQLETSLRLARHLDAAGESLSAARAYLKSAEESLDLNAAQDAIDRCDAGIRALEKLERTAAENILIARLYRTGARAAIAAGNVDDAIRRARGAVALAHVAGDARESAQTTLDLAVIEGAAFQIQEQKSDAVEAAQNARLCGDGALEAQALVQEANAAREFGLREEALQAGHRAWELALKCGRADLALAALEELLRAQITWWLFDDALATARTGMDVARRGGPLVDASFLQVRSALSYLLERFNEAQMELQATLRLASESIARRQEALVGPIRPLPLLQFGCHYMTGKIAAACGEWDKATDAVQKAAALTNVAKLPRQSEALTLLRIETLLYRNRSGDSEVARELSARLPESTRAQGMIGWSDCVELSRACVAARLHMPMADTLLGCALNTLEENAHRAPLDSDRAFARLSDAAAEFGDTAVANRARVRSSYYRSRRVAAAGVAWGRQNQKTQALR